MGARVVLTVIYRVVVFVAALCIILLTVEAIYLQAKVAAAVSRFEQQISTPTFDQPSDAPTPAATATGCPFGPGQCGD